MSPSEREQRGRIPRRVREGTGEAIFDVLPQRVLDNLRRPASENALVWNLLYPLAQPEISLRALLAMRPLWGTAALDLEEDDLRPYFWGYAISGEKLPGLEDALQRIDGPGPQTEVDIFLVGKRNLVLVEAKNRSSLGRCARHQKGRCPEIHFDGEAAGGTCRYWEDLFPSLLNFGPRPEPEGPVPACSTHYQMARTLLVGEALAQQMGKALHLWMIAPRSRWKGLQPRWQDFCERVLDHELWRRMRVLAWEDVRALR